MSKKGEGKEDKAVEREGVVRRGEVMTEDGEILSSGNVIDAVEDLGGTIRNYQEDFERWAAVQRRRRLLWWVGGFLLVVLGFGGGVLIEREFEIVPLKDSTGGWRDHVWDSVWGTRSRIV